MLLVSSSRYPDQWIVPGGGMEPEEEPGGAAVREVYEEVRCTVVACLLSFHTHCTWEDLEFMGHLCCMH